MNGPAHYREAERLLDMAHRFTYGDGADPIVGQALATEALAHATLAHAAATAMASAGPDGMALTDFKAWDAVAGIPTDGGNS